MEIDRGIKEENTESKNFDYGGLNLENQHEGCTRCLELSDKFTKAEEKCVKFELDVEKKNHAIELLEDEVRVLKQRNEELEKCIRNPEGEDDKLTLLMGENKVLEIEKKKAETEINAWKVKCKELEMQVKQGKPGEPLSVQTQGTPTIEQFTQFEGFEGGRERELKPGFLGEASSQKNISPLTPGIRCPSVPIVIIDDSDDDDLNTKNVHTSTDVGSGQGVPPDKKEVTTENKFEQDVEDHSDEEKNNCFIPTKRRKIRRQAAFIVASDSESDTDDDVPLCQLGNKKSKRKKRFVRRRLKRVGENEDNNKSTGNQGKISSDKSEIEMDDLSCEGEGTDSFIVKTSDEDSESEDNNKSTRNQGKGKISSDEREIEMDDLSCEGESMDSFIVKTSDEDSESKSASENDGTCSEVEYDEVMSSLRRGRKDKMVWEYEADMLADLAKRPELCMKGVCAIYRRQTCDEQSRQTTLYVNHRGFSHTDGSIGSDLAGIIMSLDPQGDVKKKVEKLEKVYPGGVEECRGLSIKYSKQLFEIYQTQEDPLFHP